MSRSESGLAVLAVASTTANEIASTALILQDQSVVIGRDADQTRIRCTVFILMHFSRSRSCCNCWLQQLPSEGSINQQRPLMTRPGIDTSLNQQNMTLKPSPSIPNILLVSIVSSLPLRLYISFPFCLNGDLLKTASKPRWWGDGDGETNLFFVLVVKIHIQVFEVLLTILLVPKPISHTLRNKSQQTAEKQCV